MRRRQVLAAGGMLFAALSGCTTSEESDRQPGEANNGGDDPTATDSPVPADDPTSTATPTPTEADQLVELLEHEWYNNGSYDAGVSGVLKNVSGEELSYVEVKVFFLDSEGTQIGEGLDNTTELAADRRWQFDASYLDDNPNEVDSYEIQTDVSNY